MMNGTCGRGLFFLGTGAAKKCEEMAVHVHYSSATFSVTDWSVKVRGNRVYDRIAGPEHRLTCGFRAHGDSAMRLLPHGLVGQSFSSSVEPRLGKIDVYPATGRFTTSAMAEGAIDGEAENYEVGAPHATAFAFSRFDAVPAVASGNGSEAGFSSEPDAQPG